MDEFAAKKLGEVMAFCRAGRSIFDKGDEALSQVYKNTSSIVSQFSEQEDALLKIAESHSVTEAVEAKAQKTGDKLLNLAEMYIGDEWDNPAELLEWMGFFEGAAIVHWKLVEGTAQKMGDNDLKELVNDALKLHNRILQETGEKIMQYAKSK